MKEYCITIYEGVKPRQESFDSLLRALLYAMTNTLRDDVWTLDICRDGSRIYSSHSHYGRKRR